MPRTKKNTEQEKTTNETEEKKFNCIPPLKRKRNEYGLIENINYHFKEDGSVDWKKMIPSEFLVINVNSLSDEQKEKFEKEELSIDSLPDKNLLVLLPGIRYLADLRGFQEENTIIRFFDQEDGANAECNITWIKNYESETIVSSGQGDATKNNCDQINGKYYFSAIASNRAFVRAVRNFLKIDICGKDEIGKVKTKNIEQNKEPHQEKAKESEPNENNPKKTLEKVLGEAGLSFERFKRGIIDRKARGEYDGDPDWKSFDDIDVPKFEYFQLIGFVQDYIKSKT